MKDYQNINSSHCGKKDYNIKSYKDFIDLCPVALNSIDDFNEALHLLNKSIQTLESVNSKGFVNSIEIRDYPIVGSLVDEFVNLKDASNPSLGYKTLEKWERQHIYI